MTREQISSIIGMKPKNIDLYLRAFVHESALDFVNKNLPILEPYKESYERLEFLGDSILYSVTTEFIHDNYNLPEGESTRFRAKIICGTSCCKFSKLLQLGQYVIVPKKYDDYVVSNSILEDVFEALVGAIFKDLGYTATSIFILKLVKNLDLTAILKEDHNYKDILMRYAKRNNYLFPIYTVKSKEVIEAIPPIPSKNIFTVTMSLKKNNNPFIEEYGRGKGSTRQEAEQDACKDSICTYNGKDLLHFKECKKLHGMEEIIERRKKI